jgi:hypothetical protein
MDILDELNAGEPANGEATPVETPVAEAPAEAPAPQAPEGETAEQQATRERDEKGRFKAKEEKPEVPQGYVPVGVVQELREEIRSLKQPVQQAPQQPVAPPDIFENPEGYTQYFQNQIAQTALNDRLNLSEEMVRQSTGDETVNAAQEWGRQMLAANPMFAQTFYAQRNPYGFLVGEYKRSQTLSQLGNADPSEVEQFIKWREAQQAPQTTPQPQAVPTSLASAQSARGVGSSYQPPSLDEILKG